jgi:uncharacterized protein (TIGR02466 family)
MSQQDPETIVPSVQADMVQADMVQADMVQADMVQAHMVEQGQLEYIFPTPIFRYVLQNAAALNDQLRGVILERERATPSASKSNQGGWQSQPDLFQWGEPGIAALGRLVRSAINIATESIQVPSSLKLEFRLHGWAAVNRKGHYNTAHVHPGSTWSGTYYVDAGDETPEAPGAVLEFLHPITAAAMSFFEGVLPSARLVRPQSGMIILFPSYLQHSVRVYGGERPRICVAFNAHAARRVS